MKNEVLRETEEDALVYSFFPVLPYGIFMAIFVKCGSFGKSFSRKLIWIKT
jgi:hypothetical protein